MNPLVPCPMRAADSAGWPTASGPAAGSATAAVTRPRRQLQLHDVDNPGRAEVQAYIQHRYAQAYGAHIREWQPTLVSLRERGEIVAAAGYRSAASPLYLERYLPRPIEQCLPVHGAALPRARIVEAGQFASMRPGAGRLLIAEITRHFVDQGFDWVVMTITRELLHLFERMGLHPLVLAEARPTALSPAEALAWGRYYHHEPVVVAGELRPAARRLGGRT